MPQAESEVFCNLLGHPSIPIGTPCTAVDSGQWQPWLFSHRSQRLAMSCQSWPAVQAEALSKLQWNYRPSTWKREELGADARLISSAPRISIGFTCGRTVLGRVPAHGGSEHLCWVVFDSSEINIHKIKQTSGNSKIIKIYHQGSPAVQCWWLSWAALWIAMNRSLTFRNHSTNACSAVSHDTWSMLRAPRGARSCVLKAEVPVRDAAKIWAMWCQEAEQCAGSCTFLYGLVCFLHLPTNLQKVI